MVATGIAPFLRRDNMRVQVKAFVVAELPTPTPLIKRCEHNQAYRPRMQRHVPLANAYEGVEVKDAQG